MSRAHHRSPRRLCRSLSERASGKVWSRYEQKKSNSLNTSKRSRNKFKRKHRRELDRSTRRTWQLVVEQWRRCSKIRTVQNAPSHHSFHAFLSRAKKLRTWRLPVLRSQKCNQSPRSSSKRPGKTRHGRLRKVTPPEKCAFRLKVIKSASLRRNWSTESECLNTKSCQWWATSNSSTSLKKKSSSSEMKSKRSSNQQRRRKWWNRWSRHILTTLLMLSKLRLKDQLKMKNSWVIKVQGFQMQSLRQTTTQSTRPQLKLHNGGWQWTKSTRPAPSETPRSPRKKSKLNQF